MWSSPVAFAHETRGTVSIDSALQALHILDGWWLRRDGLAFKVAIDTCVEAIQGDRPQEDARAAFINALIEGNIAIVPYKDKPH